MVTGLDKLAEHFGDYADRYVLIGGAAAWLDLSERKAGGENVDSRDIKKHRADVVRLCQLLEPDLRIDKPEPIKNDLGKFLDQMAMELTGDMLKQWGLGGTSPGDVLELIRDVYGLKNP